MTATSHLLMPDERRVLARLADVLVPRSGDMPSASEVALCNAPIDRALASRPDLLPTVRALVARARDCHAHEFVREIEKDDPIALQALLQLIAGAYYMLPEVRAMLGYAGQARR
ncbi:hypothetical protein [Ancylobacter pratisalsi]|uniref:Uncharacterized protein n=1 Tax=Ancylobacter pratisalsi TaxID=1745854 RepID=A0A6P1YIA8_9HYPH|nr:hypothetical protein [Ancylobacter pratisalsi]QIB33067.1 hypothetical protein G3A50_04575 [Ancylobacter pratisalsi]